MAIAFDCLIKLQYVCIEKEINFVLMLTETPAPMNIGIQTNRLEENRTCVGYSQLKQFYLYEIVQEQEE